VGIYKKIGLGLLWAKQKERNYINRINSRMAIVPVAGSIASWLFLR